MVRRSLHAHSTRRQFLRQAGLASMGLFLADEILAHPYRPVHWLLDDARHVRITGRVTVAGAGVKGAVVSDGVSVVATAADGTYTLHSTDRHEYVFLSLPSGTEVPVNPTGTARFYQPIAPRSGDEMAASWDLRRLDGSDDRHRFLVLADPQVLDMDDVKRFQSETVSDIREVASEEAGPLFAVGCGDLMFDRLNLFPEYEKAVAMSGVPSFQVLGNHDVVTSALSDEPSARIFREHFGPTWYSFNRGEIHYVVLDDVLWLGRGYFGYIDDVQLNWLRQDLSFVEKGRTVVVFLHIPVYDKQHERNGETKPENASVVVNRQALYKVLEGYDAHCLVGHMHESEHLRDGGVRHHVCGAVCGAWWSADMCGDGTPNGYAVYEASGSTLRWRYRSTGKRWDHQISVHPRGADPKRPEAVIANVWDADEAWEVTWYEDGVRAGKMERFLGADPVTVRLFEGKTLPKKHTWVEPYQTDHLFRAVPAAKAREVVVEARDRFGRVYRTALP
jgi:hypothetical protein